MKLTTPFEPPIGPNNITQNATLAAQWLQQGELLAYPTESVWGIGCDAYNKKAVEQILAIKKRPRDKGMIVVTDSIERMSPLLTHLPKERRQQIIGSWCSTSNNKKTETCDATSSFKNQPLVRQSASQIIPAQRQAHTWLLPISDDTDQKFPTWITGKHHSIAVRVIHHPLIAQLCANMVSKLNPYGFIVSTSCNPSGQQPAVNLDMAINYFGSDIKYLGGETLNYTLPSQIRDAITGQVIR